MPIYEYLCKKCGKKFEVLISGTDKAVCPGCKSGELEKQFSTFSTPGPDCASRSSHSSACGCCNPKKGCGK